METKTKYSAIAVQYGAGPTQYESFEALTSNQYFTVDAGDGQVLLTNQDGHTVFFAYDVLAVRGTPV